MRMRRVALVVLVLLTLPSFFVQAQVQKMGGGGAGLAGACAGGQFVSAIVAGSVPTCGAVSGTLTLVTEDVPNTREAVAADIYPDATGATVSYGHSLGYISYRWRTLFLGVVTAPTTIALGSNMLALGDTTAGVGERYQTGYGYIGQTAYSGFLMDNAGGSFGYGSFYWASSVDGIAAPVTVVSWDHLGFIASTATQLTAATMTPEKQGEERTVTSSYTWTTAMVTALGGASGDISLATLPAKTVVRNAYVIITGACGGGTIATCTVACGRTGALYIDYIVASDATAAANTVYGDASGERGTNLTGYDLPSYTGTTALSCHFIATGDTLNNATLSTGRVVLETTLIP